jgi:DNA-binding GntR family transcriptional regulator
MSKQKTSNVRIPRYRVLADRLVADIRQGRLKVGSRLAGEIELCATLGLSRHTIRAALRVLEDLGLIGRRRGAGTIVISKAPARSYVQAVRSPSELLQYPAASSLTVQSIQPIKAGRKLAVTLDGVQGKAWIKVGALRTLDEGGFPICWLDLYLDPQFAAITASIGRKRMPVYEMIERQFGIKIASVEINIRASLVSQDLHSRLKVSAGTPSLNVTRRYFSEDMRIVQVSVSEHPADRYHYSLQLRRGWQPGLSGGWAAV